MLLYLSDLRPDPRDLRGVPAPRAVAVSDDGAILRKMNAASIPVPGQTMDIELSDGDTAEVVPPRKKEARGADPASPTKRRASEPEVVSAAMIRALLSEQTKELKGSLKAELSAAIEKSETKMTGQITQIRNDLDRKLDANATEIQTVKQMQDQLLSRVGALENGASSTGQTAQARKPTLVFGGWKADTRRAVILSDLAAALKIASAEELIDQSPWVPGARHSISLSEMTMRKDESESARDQRMLSIISQINEPRVAVQKLAAGNTLWAAISRPRSERGSGSHASKIRRLLHGVGADFGQVDAVYATGSIWYKDILVGSVDRPRNGPHVVRGKLDHSWVDLVALSKTTGVAKDELETMWNQIVG